MGRVEHLAERQLALVLAIDRIRDQTPDEREMTAQIVSTLAEAVEAEVCLLCLRDDDSGELQLRALTDRASLYSAPGAEPALRALAQRAADSSGPRVSASLDLDGGRQAFGVALPLRVGAESLGALLLVNLGRPFDAAELALVDSASSQIDSAMQHARVLRDLRRRQAELEIIYRIDRLRDRLSDLDALLDAVLAEVCAVLEAESSFLMLYDRGGNALELRAVTGRDLFGADAAARQIRELSEEAIRTGEMISRMPDGDPLRALLGVPLILKDKLIGVLGVANRRGRAAFTRADRQMLRAIASQMDTAIFENLQSQRLRGAFGLCVGPQVMERLISISDRDLLSVERRLVTILFSDIRGFTSMAEQIDADLLQGVLNDHLSALTDLVLAYEGTLDKYIGDSIMCFFNAPEDQPDHALRAARLALEMQAAHARVMDRWQNQLPLPPIGIGISTGETMLGNFGSVRRLDYTAIGHDVNLAARLCAAAEGGQVIISAATHALIAEHVVTDALPPLRLKGIEGEVECWSLRGMK